MIRLLKILSQEPMRKCTEINVLQRKDAGMIMSDKRLKVCFRGAAVFLAVSIVFCIAVICGVNIQKSNMEKQRLDTETKLAEMQMPTFAPQSTEEVKSDGDGATGESNAVKTAAGSKSIRSR